MDGDDRDTQFAIWDEVRVELAQFGSAEQLERARRDLRTYLDGQENRRRTAADPHPDPFGDDPVWLT